ncbi:MAG: hypothetical protein JWP01_3970 [Myxococcales bacterium]|nr:hypothetical protein [Myxococcales bacterium]
MPDESELVTAACTALAGIKHTIAEAEPHVADGAGLYAIHGAPEIWQQLGLGDPPDDRPLYVGKAEASLRARDLRQHFGTGATGSSTVRRTFAAMLRDALGFRGVPRDKSNPRKWSHYALSDEHEIALTEWMRANLKLAVWAKAPECGDLHDVEKRVLARLVPPLNIQDNPTSPWLKQVKGARKVMAKDAQAWAVAKGFKV